VHRIGGPAIINYYVNGNVKSESWYENGTVYRIGGPPVIQYDDAGNVISERVNSEQ
jgi:antitoxin component YwqK of YwqJK toxin-antitoxin module